MYYIERILKSVFHTGDDDLALGIDGIYRSNVEMVCIDVLYVL